MKIYTKPFSPSLKLGKTFKRMVASTIDMKTRLQAKRMFLDAEQSFLNRTYYKPERTKNDE
jgi:hypothetical protein